MQCADIPLYTFVSGCPINIQTAIKYKKKKNFLKNKQTNKQTQK
jgi:hypothetical protein